jgi:branched-chain amino acid transport system substrate-binding protein
MWRKATYLAALAAIALLAASCGGSDDGGGGAGRETITIAWIGDRSGPTVVAQAPVLHGLEAYIRYTNDNGGVNGDRIKLLVKDDQYSPAKELQLTKQAVESDGAVLVTGLGQSSGIASIVPYLTQQQVPGLINQATLREVSDPFQEWMFEGNCNYSDQADVALAYVMDRLGLETLEGKTVGVAGIEVASGQEWISIVRKRVEELGGRTVDVTLPAAIVSADVQVQSLRNANVDFILMHHAAPGAIAMLKSMAKYGMTDTLVSGSFGVTNENTWLQAPRSTAKNFVGTNCYTPPALADSEIGRLAVETGEKYGYDAAEINQMNWSLGWVNGMIIVEALKNADGEYTGPAVKEGLEEIESLDTGGLSPTPNISDDCHMAIRQVRPYTFDYEKKQIQPIGDYEDWAQYVTNGYAAEGTCED